MRCQCNAHKLQTVTTVKLSFWSVNADRQERYKFPLKSLNKRKVNLYFFLVKVILQCWPVPVFVCAQIFNQMHSLLWTQQSSAVHTASGLSLSLISFKPNALCLPNICTAHRRSIFIPFSRPSIPFHSSPFPSQAGIYSCFSDKSPANLPYSALQVTERGSK